MSQVHDDIRARTDEIEALVNVADQQDAGLRGQVATLTEALDQETRRADGAERDLSNALADLEACRAGEEPSPPPPPPDPDPAIEPSLIEAWNGEVILEDGFEQDLRRWTLSAEPGNPAWLGRGEGGAVQGAQGYARIIPDPTGQRGGHVFRCGVDPDGVVVGSAGQDNKSQVTNWWVTMGRGAIVDGAMEPVRPQTEIVLEYCLKARFYVPADFPSDVAGTMLMQIKAAGLHHPMSFHMGRGNRHLVAATRIPGGSYRTLGVRRDIVLPLETWFEAGYRVVLAQSGGRFTVGYEGEIVFDFKNIQTSYLDPETGEVAGAYFGVGNYVFHGSDPLPKCHYLIDDVRCTRPAA